jgi:hypothetical protein
MLPEIPPDQLERIRPVVAPVLEEVRRLAHELPDDADSALIYAPAVEPEERP